MTTYNINRQAKQQANKTNPPNPNFGTFAFFQSLTPAAFKNAKEPNFFSRTPLLQHRQDIAKP
jgi:hypothetical protein